ncbi:MAG: putative selenium-dependent hydroxylase accessory protein YqeC [Candidatus Marinimicrobia bacterium]|nr:putative selenium-dependent hydroxylase accessory protein YqeC [Candidatus Neomarinimicrobiota bacterium]MCF7850238.1 putative selenium-dependent hydroxylase accessory protein YqeC [Candidatus Neomarinimicrobiota bacterium]MCF7903720.1 putative selenium-dependent hydroxylase accessory protein YqeC [Candidatus Neomarinimicrobiota bacterium]
MKFTEIIFGIEDGITRACIGILGGGGKTALMYKLGEELAGLSNKVILTSLTKAGVSPQHEVHYFKDVIDRISEEDKFRPNPLYIMGEEDAGQKLIGVDAEQLKQLNRISDFTIFECDGARKRPIKAHQPHDPKLPDYTTHGVIVVGADSVGARIDGKLVHRPELFRELWDVNANYELEPAFIAKVLTSQYGYMDKVPKGVRLSYLVNKADIYPEQADQLAIALVRHTDAPVFQGSIEKKKLRLNQRYS